jgi:hypothetical protein
MIIAIILFNLLLLSNAAWAMRVHQLQSNPIEKVVTKEIEVVKKAMCECGHVSSTHKTNTGTCQALTFFTDEGRVKLSRSIECPCQKYTGPLPLTEYFDDQMRELESTRV